MDALSLPLPFSGLHESLSAQPSGTEHDVDGMTIKESSEGFGPQQQGQYALFAPGPAPMLQPVNDTVDDSDIFSAFSPQLVADVVPDHEVKGTSNSR